MKSVVNTTATERKLYELEQEINSLKEIIHNLLMTNNPAYKKKKALEEVDDFLGKRFGRTGTS